MDIRQGSRVARTAFFISSAVAFIGLGLYLMEYVVLGVILLIMGIAGIVISFAVLKVAMISQALIDNKNSKSKNRK